MWGWGGDKIETVNEYECKVYTCSGVEVVTKTRVEHLAEDDKKQVSEGNKCTWQNSKGILHTEN